MSKDSANESAVQRTETNQPSAKPAITIMKQTHAVHEVPISRLARRLREAQDTAWGSAPVIRTIHCLYSSSLVGVGGKRSLLT